jgi:outer membrane protein assembly factor BamB
MTAMMMKRRTALLLSGAALAACTTPKPKIPGTQIPVLPETNGLETAANAPAVTVPPATPYKDWPQLLGGPAHAPGNIAGPSGLSQSWAVKIGAAGGFRQPLQASPIVAGGMIFTMDAEGVVAAFDQKDGGQLWRTPTRPKHVTVQPLGGGIGFDGGTVYASTGFAEILSIDAGSGKINWRQALDFPARAAPTIAAGIVAVVTQNDLLLTFDAGSGAPGWRFTGKVTDSPASVSVTGAPAFESGILVAGFSSGTLAALDVNSGTPVWEQSLSSAFGQASTLDFSDIVAPPVIAGGVVYAASLGQTVLAIDLHSGAKVWEIDVSGTEALCLAGGTAYFLNTQQKLAAINADDGLIAWVSPLPAFGNMKKKKKPRAYHGPVMVNGQLMFTTSLGEIALVDPVSGAPGPITKLNFGPADLAPVVAGGALFVLTRNGELTAYA